MLRDLLCIPQVVRLGEGACGASGCCMHCGLSCGAGFCQAAMQQLLKLHEYGRIGELSSMISLQQHLLISCNRAAILSSMM